MIANEPVVVAHYPFRTAAEAARLRLEAEGMPAFLSDAETVEHELVSRQRPRLDQDPGTRGGGGTRRLNPPRDRTAAIDPAVAATAGSFKTARRHHHGRSRRRRSR